jgi:hypothetical protein
MFFRGRTSIQETSVEDRNVIQIRKSLLDLLDRLEHIVGHCPDDIELDYVTPW